MGGGNYYAWLNLENDIIKKSGNVLESSLISKNLLNKNNVINKIMNCDNSLPNSSDEIKWFIEKYSSLYNQPKLEKIVKNSGNNMSIFHKHRFIKILLEKYCKWKKICFERLRHFFKTFSF